MRHWANGAARGDGETIRAGGTLTGMRTVSGLLGLVLVAACQSAGTPTVAPSTSASSPPAARASAEPPAGWRTETYRGVQVAVPDTWGWGTGAQRIGQWCVGRSGDRPPVVGRPGASTLVGCLAEDDLAKDGPSAGPPETLIAHTGVIVAFFDIAPDDDPTRLPRGGDRVVRELAGVRVIIQVPDDLRDEIAASVRVVDRDANGCPVDHPIADDPSIRPAPATDVREVEGVIGATACRYGLGLSGAPSLLSSHALGRVEAAAVVRGIADAPEGGGPDDATACVPQVADGHEVIVLRISAQSGPAVVHVRFSGCDHHGFDDGVTVRDVTREPMQSLIADANTIYGYDGVMADVLAPSAGRDGR